MSYYDEIKDARNEWIAEHCIGKQGDRHGDVPDSKHEHNAGYAARGYGGVLRARPPGVWFDRIWDHRTYWRKIFLQNCDPC